MSGTRGITPAGHNVFSVEEEAMMFRFGLSVLIALAVWGSSAQAQEKIRLGFIVALSGPFGVIGAEQKRGMELAMEQLGGKLGGVDVEVFSADSKSNPGAATQEASKLIDRDHVQIVTGGTGSNEVMAIAKPITSAATTTWVASPPARSSGPSTTTRCGKSV